MGILTNNKACGTGEAPIATRISAGWAREGRVDAVVNTALLEDLRTAAMEAGKGDWIAGTLAVYILDASYYLARQGDRGWDAVVSGMAPFARAVAREQARDSAADNT